jgi:hypothetical protein
MLSVSAGAAEERLGEGGEVSGFGFPSYIYS